MAGLWHRWFDAREYRRALQIAERNYAYQLGRTVEMDRLRADAVIRASNLRADLDAAIKLHAQEKERGDGLLKQLEALQHVDQVRASVAARHEDVSKLPPQSEDRKALTRLEDENDRLRAQNERLIAELREAREPTDEPA